MSLLDWMDLSKLCCNQAVVLSNADWLDLSHSIYRSSAAHALVGLCMLSSFPPWTPPTLAITSCQVSLDAGMETGTDFVGIESPARYASLHHRLGD